MAQLKDLLVIGDARINGRAIIGDLGVNSKITQGSPSNDSTITNMNRFQADLFVEGNGSAPTQPKAAGFYLGKSASDGNRHMDIVSGETYSYIDFNKADNNLDYDARLLVDVNTGYTEFKWDGSKSSKILNVCGSLQQNGVQVALSNQIPTTPSAVGAAPASHTHGYIQDGTVGIKTSDSNEVSFASNANYIYFGYDNRLNSTGVVTNYKFGTHSGVAGASKGIIECGAVIEDGTTLSEKYAPKSHTHSYVPTSRTVNGKALSSNISLSASDVGAAPAYTYGTTDLTAGTSTLATGTMYLVYE